MTCKTIYHFYRDGFRQLSPQSRALWAIILIKLAVIFLVLRVFFFQPAMSGLSTEQKQMRVATELTAH